MEDGDMDMDMDIRIMDHMDIHMGRLHIMAHMDMALPIPSAHLHIMAHRHIMAHTMDIVDGVLHRQ